MTAVTVFTTFTDNVAWVDETIASVLAQTFSDFELLILNDGDPAESRRIARDFPDPRIRIVDLPPTPLAAKRQQGLELAHGRYVAVLDSDDFSEPERLARQVAWLDEHPDCVIAGSAIRFIDAHSQTLGYRSYPADDAALRARLLEVNCFAHSAVTFRREAALAAGGYRPEFLWIEDYDLWLRMASHGTLHNFAEPLTAYRIHGRSMKSRFPKTSLWATVRLKVKAVRHYGYRLGLRSAMNIGLHAALLLLPSRAVLWLFERAVMKKEERNRLPSPREAGRGWPRAG
jgi:glycosyltransferase involved in cell wall biosynthesis